MVGEKVDFATAVLAAHDMATGDREKRDRSLIDFPYVPLDGAVDVAKAIYERCAFGSCDQDELAAEMGQTISGAFRVKTSSAKTFGLVEKDGRSAFRLTELGKRIVVDDPSAKVDAFLTVPLYQEIYGKFRGHNLPPMKALEREMETLGVPKKQTDRARQVFDRSAHFAGFFESGKDRLVRPRMDATQPAAETAPKGMPGEDAPAKKAERGGSGSGGGEPPHIDPIIQGLINRLPMPGDVWEKSKRKLWLQILENSFDLVYDDGLDEESRKLV